MSKVELELKSGVPKVYVSSTFTNKVSIDDHDCGNSTISPVEHRQDDHSIA
jgi:hypothetical protein